MLANKPKTNQTSSTNIIKGQPSGEAFIQMDSEEAAYASAKEKHNKYMLPGKNQKIRYIEVFQVSYTNKFHTFFLLLFLSLFLIHLKKKRNKNKRASISQTFNLQ